MTHDTATSAMPAQQTTGRARTNTHIALRQALKFAVLHSLVSGAAASLMAVMILRG